MSYVSNQIIDLTYKAWTKKTTTCGWQAGTGAHKVLANKEQYVTSWRGPIETINVGSKRRRVFREFNIIKYTGSYWNAGNKVSNDLWCPSSGNVWTGTNLFEAQLVYGIDAFQVSLGKPYYSYFNESTVPMYRSGDWDSVCEHPRNLVITDLYVKLKDPRWDGAVFFAELIETLYSLKSILEGAVKAYAKAGKNLNYFRNFKGNRVKFNRSDQIALASAKTGLHFLLNTEELWLWYRYFLIPAMLDAEDLLKAIKPQAKIDRVQAGSQKKTKTSNGTIVSYVLNGTAKPPLEINWEQRCTYRAGGAIDITKRLDPNEWGVSAYDIVRAGWEVIPFSFVFDWFINMGDFLTTLRQVEIDYAQSYATYACESDIFFKPGSGCTASNNPGRINQVLIDRIVDLEPPTHPMSNDKYSTFLHILDATALATGILKSLCGRKQRRK
jgi:hypothetical protein